MGNYLSAKKGKTNLPNGNMPKQNVGLKETEKDFSKV